MSDFATKKDVQDIVDNAVGRVVDDLSGVIADFATQVDKRFVTLESRFENRFDRLEKEIIDLKASHDRLLNTVDAFVKRLDDQEIETAARDAQFARLLDWAQKVSDKTGIPLPALK